MITNLVSKFEAIAIIASQQFYQQVNEQSFLSMPTEGRRCGKSTRSNSQGNCDVETERSLNIWRNFSLLEFQLLPFLPFTPD